MTSDERVALERRMDALEAQLRSLERRLDLLMGGLAVVVVAGQLILGAWLSAVIR